MLAVQTRSKVNKNSEAHALEEGIDYDEVFALVARIEATRIFLDFTSYMGFIVYQMDVKSAFLYGTVDEEVYVIQPSGFVDPKFHNKVYKVVKALYGLHQAPRAWYATLFTSLEKSRYRRGAIDKTLFIKQDKKDIMLVQVYVDDIIFGSTKKSWCDEFEEIMKNRFQMSSMGELTFFLGLQVKQKDDGIFISLDKSMIGSLMYLTASSLDIMFAVYACSRFQVTLKTPHLQAVKRIFRYLKGQPKLGLWYPKVSSFDLEAYSDSDYASANIDRKSTTGATLVKGRLLEVTTTKHRLILPSIVKSWLVQSKRLLATVLIKKTNDVVKLRALIDGKRVVVTKDIIRQILHLDDADGVECLPNEGIFTELAQEKDDVEVPNAPTPPSPTTTPSPPPQEHITTSPQAQPAPPSSPPQEPPTTTSKYSMTLLSNLRETCATLSQKVATLEQDKVAQALEILKLKIRVKKLEKQRRFKSSGGCIQTGGRIKAIDADEDITLVDAETQVDLGPELQGRKDDDNVAAKEVSATEPTVFDDEEVTMTMAQTLIKMKAKKARLLDEQMAKRLHDEEVKHATAREKQEKDDLEQSKVLQ
nr:putative ribonuclease H-like domain-containing protein [Tanacetum cinerariifolium]